MKKDYVPILVQKEQNTDIWQMDVSNMNLSELIALRDALRGYHDISIRVIDGILNNNMGISFTYCRDYKKEIKEEKRKTKIKEVRKRNKNWRKKRW